MYKKHWVKIRALIQFAFWLLFCLLIIGTRDPISNGDKYTFFQRLSFHLGITASISGKEILFKYWPALIILILTIFLGRFFCGIICPLGSTIDFCDNRIKTGKKIKFNKKNYKYVVLLISFFLSVTGLQFAGIIDPLSLVYRVYTIVFYPAFDFIVKRFFDLLYKITFLESFTDYIYNFFNKIILDYNKISFVNFLPVLFIIIIFVIFAKLTPRFWCRYLCPLGALLALSARFPLFKRVVDKKKCVNCLQCEEECPMHAIYKKGEATYEAECIRCLKCLKSCDYNAIKFKFGKSKQKPKQKPKEKSEKKTFLELTRKNFLSGMLGSVMLWPVFRFSLNRNKTTYLIRPPGSLNEEDFLEKCIRCGQCMKVCPTNALHPVFLESGLSGIFTPCLIPRRGYCEYNCNLCSEVCPTGAIEKFLPGQKEKIKIGTAYIIKDLCFAWAENKNCLVCEEMCPVSTKAIKVKKRVIEDNKSKSLVIKLPYVVSELCIGCGICENKCPVQGSAAIRVRTLKLK